MFLDRRSEAAALGRLLDDTRAGESRALVVRGEPGVGKSALLAHMIEAADGFRVLRGEGVQSEAELAFAAVHRVCGPLLDRVGALPRAQRDTLETAFGLRSGPPSEGVRVGLAVLTLLSEAAAEQPVLCVVDDAQWLDGESAQALGVVARRLRAEPVALVLAARDSYAAGAAAGVPVMELGGLPAGDARTLLATAITGPLDQRVRERIVAETRGNPLAILELPRAMGPVELAGGFAAPDVLPLSNRIEDSFRRRLGPLPPDTRMLLLLASAEPGGEADTVSAAAARLGIAPEAVHAAVEAGLVELAPPVRFRHPLVRSAVYRAAAPEDRRDAHAALAACTDRSDADRAAWHRAQAVAGPDEQVAAELERSAGRAQARGGLAAAGAFLERAAVLTPDPADRSRRAIEAAQAKHLAGAPEAALALAAAAEAGPLDELERARIELLRAQVAFATRRGADAPPLLLKAAGRLESLDVALARATYLDAISAATFVGRLERGCGLRQVAEAARAAPPPAGPASGSDLLLDGLALLLTDGHAAAAPTLAAALAEFRAGRVAADEEVRWLWLAGHVALDLWDDEGHRALAARHVELARAAGALAVLPIALNTRAGVHIAEGEFADAEALLEEVRAVTEATGGELAPYVGLVLAAFRGDEADASARLDATLEAVRGRGEGIGVTIAHWAGAVLFNGLGRYEEALASARVASEYPADLRFAVRSHAELIEAASRTGDHEEGREALARLVKTTRANATELALGYEARARALLAEGEEAERHYAEAVERMGRTRVRTASARAHLIYGEWLRRARRRVDARTHLRTAHDMFTAIGMGAFAERAARELNATGEHARRRRGGPSDTLTAQEAQIARLAAEGLSNPEIGARLFISPRTVEHHLRSVFAKLGLSSRAEVAQALTGRATA